MKKFINTSLVLGLTAGMVVAQAPEEGENNYNPLNSLSAGVRVLHLYDLPAARFNSEFNPDLQGLAGEYTGFDVGAGIYAEWYVNPFLGAQVGFATGKLTGANESEYYRNRFHNIHTDLLLNVSNLDQSSANSRWHYLARLGLGFGSFHAQRWLTSDHSFNGSVSRGYREGRAGAGVQYEYNHWLRFELDLTYHVAFDDGFDGYDQATGQVNNYLSTALGVAYSFGPRESKPVYSYTLYDNDYQALMASRDSELVAPPRLSELNAKVAALESKLAEQEGLLKQQEALLAEHRQLLEKQQQWRETFLAQVRANEGSEKRKAEGESEVEAGTDKVRAEAGTE